MPQWLFVPHLLPVLSSGPREEVKENYWPKIVAAPANWPCSSRQPHSYIPPLSSNRDLKLPQKPALPKCAPLVQLSMNDRGRSKEKEENKGLGMPREQEIQGCNRGAS